jgi:RHS repeat-associated protein
VSDHLGSPRIILGKSGSLADTRRRDFMPFGEDLGAGQFGRTTAQGCEASGTPSNPREKFATYERDDETGLDFAQARYYQNRLGRFTTPDEFTGGPTELFVLGNGDGEKQALPYAEIANPQTLNKYQYCLNNPLRYADSNGHQPQESRQESPSKLREQLIKNGVSPQEAEKAVQIYREQFKPVAILGLILTASGVALSAPEIIQGLMLYAAQNPQAVQQIGNEALEASTGNPMPASTMRSAAEIGVSIGNAVKGQATGKLDFIAQQVTKSGLSQSDAVTATQSAVKATGLSSIVAPQANGSIVVASVMVGDNKQVFIVNAQGAVSRATATIDAGVKNGKPFFSVSNIKNN